MLLFGLGLGLVLQYTVVRPLQQAASGNCEEAMRSYWPDNVFVRSLTTLADLDPHLLLHIFIPPLIYESASAIEWHVFFNLKWTALLLAIPRSCAKLACSFRSLVLVTLFNLQLIQLNACYTMRSIVSISDPGMLWVSW